jgi:hypothetical protein
MKEQSKCSMGSITRSVWTSAVRHTKFPEKTLDKLPKVWYNDNVKRREKRFLTSADRKSALGASMKSNSKKFSERNDRNPLTKPPKCGTITMSKGKGTASNHGTALAPHSLR